MSATKAFELVVGAYQAATGQTQAKAKAEVAEELARSWALAAFGPGIASRVGQPEPEPEPEGGESE